MSEHDDAASDDAFDDLAELEGGDDLVAQVDLMEVAYSEVESSQRELQAKLEELAEHKEFADTILQTILDALVVLDERGQVERINLAAEGLFDCVAKDVVGAPASRLLPRAVPTDGSALPWEGETEVDGLPVLVTADAIRSADGVIRGVVVVLKDVSERKLFEQRLEGKVDELEEAQASLARTNDELKQERQRLEEQQAAMRRVAEEIAVTSREHESMAVQLTTAVTEITTSLQELSQTADQIADHVDNVAKVAEETSVAASRGSELMGGLEEEVTVIKDGSASIAERIGRLSQRSQEISRILELIAHVADRTDLLALNAAIEGAHAGAAGRGFGVVAAEMRRLAENVSDHAGDIRRVIEEVQGAVRASVLATEDGIKRTEQGGVMAERAGSAFVDIHQRVQQTSDAAQLIRVATQQQRRGTAQILQAMNDIRDTANRTLAATRHMTNALDELVGRDG